VSDEMLDKLGTLSTQSLIDGLWVMGWPDAFIEGARPLGKGQKCVGRAVTLRFVPQRPDIAADKPAGMESPEYEAFEKCGPRSVLVMASVGPWESVGGDIKFLRLKQLGVGGLVTDGSVRDTDEILNYGFPTWSFSTTPKQGAHLAIVPASHLRRAPHLCCALLPAARPGLPCASARAQARRRCSRGSATA
jgi:regulator of RNase E activity RraA